MSAMLLIGSTKKTATKVSSANSPAVHAATVCRRTPDGNGWWQL